MPDTLSDQDVTGLDLRKQQIADLRREIGEIEAEIEEIEAEIAELNRKQDVWPMTALSQPLVLEIPRRGWWPFRQAG